MALLPVVALVVALIAAPLVSVTAKQLGADPLSLVPRLALWTAALFALVVAIAAFDLGQTHLGLEVPSWKAVLLAALGALAILVLLGMSQFLQRKLGNHSTEQLLQLNKILSLPLGYRFFLVATAAVVEEVLYRGYAVGVGQHLLGGVWLASAISIAAFTLAHLRWGLVHLLPVFLSALVLTQLFVFTQNLWVCILAHAIVDAVGFLLAPAIMARRARVVSNGLG